MKNTANNHECGECTACCEGWLITNTDLIQMYPGCPCDHLKNTVCDIYVDRPENPCRIFNCSWVMAGSTMPEWLKPNNSKAIIVKGAINWQGNYFDLVVPVGRRVPQRTLNWLNENSKQTHVPYIYAEHQVINKQFTGANTIKIHALDPLKGNLQKWLDAGNTLW